MNAGRYRAAVAATLFAALLARGSPAQAGPPRAGDDVEACATSYESAQRMRNAGRLRAARAELLVCARDMCPRVVRPDCVQWLAEVERAIPSVVISAHDARGHDTIDVHVYVDGELVADHLDGRGIPVDPGRHTFRYTSNDGTVEEPVVVAEGAKDRQLVVNFGPPPDPKEKPPKPEPPRPLQPPPPVGPYLVAGGIALAGLGLFAGFAIAGKEVEACKGACSEAQITTLRRDYLIADISLGVATVAVGALIWMIASAPSTRQPAAMRRMLPVVQF